MKSPAICFTYRFKTFLRDEEGATATEYAVIIAALILAVLGAIIFLGDQSKVVFDGVGSKAGQFGKIE